MSKNIPALPDGTTYAEYQEILANASRKIRDYTLAHGISTVHDARELTDVMIADDMRVFRSLLDEREQAAYYVRQFTRELEAAMTAINPATGKPHARLDHYDELGWPVWVPND